MEALREAQKLGFLGSASLEMHIAHASEFGLCAERFLDFGGAASCDAEFPGAGPSALLDLGSGGGLPGLVLASMWKASRVVLLDSSSRRARFLERAVRSCGWEGRVSVVESRAETAGRDRGLRATFDLVVARGFGSPAVTAECSAPFLRVGGVLVVSEPPPTDDRFPEAVSPSEGSRRHRDAPEVAEAADTRRWPSAPLQLVGLGPLSKCHGRFRYQVLRQVELCPERFPRRVGVPSKRPLYVVPAS